MRAFIQAYILQPPVWMFDEKLTAKLEINGSREFDRFFYERADVGNDSFPPGSGKNGECL